MGPLEPQLFDSNIIIDSLNGVPDAHRVLTAEPRVIMVSIISWIEVLAGTRTSADEIRARAFLGALDVLPLTDEIAEEAVRLRRERGLKLPDALIFATARLHRVTFVTRNTKDFRSSESGIEVPYTL